MTTKVTYKVALEVLTHEAIVRQAYKNPGDVWTWSVGLTSATGHKVERYIGKPQSLTHCLRVYAWRWITMQMKFERCLKASS